MIRTHWGILLLVLHEMRRLLRRRRLLLMLLKMMLIVLASLVLMRRKLMLNDEARGQFMLVLRVKLLVLLLMQWLTWHNTSEHGPFVGRVRIEVLLASREQLRRRNWHHNSNSFGRKLGYLRSILERRHPRYLLALDECFVNWLSWRLIHVKINRFWGGTIREDWRIVLWHCRIACLYRL